MIYETLSIASTIILLVAALVVFYLQTKFTKGFMKSFVINSALSFFLILAERLIDIAGEFIFGINNELYHVLSLFFVLGAVLFFFRAIKALEVLKVFIPEDKK